MKTKYGFPIKSIYTVKELAANLVVNQSVLQNYLYKKSMVAKLSQEYSGEDLMMILKDYSKEAYLRKEETIERAKYLVKKLSKEEVIEEESIIIDNVGDVVKDEGEEVVEEEVIEESIVIEEDIVEEVENGGVWGMMMPDLGGEDSILKIINWVSMVSALIGIHKELDWLGVISLGFITCLFLIYTLQVMSKPESGGLKKFIACVAMGGVECFWGMFHIKTFSSFDKPDAIFSNETSFITACVIGGLSFVALLIQAFKNEEV